MPGCPLLHPSPALPTTPGSSQALLRGHHWGTLAGPSEPQFCHLPGDSEGRPSPRVFKGLKQGPAHPSSSTSAPSCGLRPALLPNPELRPHLPTRSRSVRRAHQHLRGHLSCLAPSASSRALGKPPGKTPGAPVPLPSRPGAEGLEGGGSGSGEGSRWAGIKPGSALAGWSLGRRTHWPPRSQERTLQESSCLSRPGIGPAHKGGALRVGSLPSGEGEGEGRGSIPGSRRYWGGGGRFVTQDAAPASRAAPCSPGI